MRFSKQTGGYGAAVLALTSTMAQAEDVLYSRRMMKRGIDAEGNYNICSFLPVLASAPLLTENQPSST
jgi:5'-nucleotidase